MNVRAAAPFATSLALVVATACPSTGDTTQRPSPRGTTDASPSASPVVTPSPSATAHRVSLPALMEKRFDGRDLRLGRVLARTSAYTRYAVTYRSGRFRISGIMNIPAGRGPFPVVILNHGYIDPDVYTTGRGLRREQDYLARRGYAVLHTDYRNHAASDDDPRNDITLRLGYTEDAINAVLAVRASSLASLDGERVAMLGRSMGGGVTLNALVVAPGLVDAAVVFAPVSADAADNFDKWVRRSETGDRIIATYGSPEDRPRFWRDLSASSFFERVEDPLQIHHGTADDTCPIAWSRRTADGLRAAGKDVRLLEYEGEGHAFGPAFSRSMARTVSFLEQHLRAG